LERYHYLVGDSIYIEYENISSGLYVLQHLSIVGQYSVLPGVDPVTSDYDDNFLICQDQIGLFDFIPIGYSNWLVEYEKPDTSASLSSSELETLNMNLIDEIENYDFTMYAWPENSWIITDNGYAFSMLNFLNIEKIYLLSLVTIGIGVIMYVSIQEKSIDFGILRARGVAKKIIFKTQISEGAVFLALGTLISLTSFISSYALNKSIGSIVFQDIAIPRVFSVPILTILLEIAISIGIFLGIIYISTYFVSKRSDVKNISDIFRMS
jgi:hypothetical protein